MSSVAGTKRKEIDSTDGEKSKSNAGRKPDKFPSLPSNVQSCLDILMERLDAVQGIDAPVKHQITAILNASEKYDNEILDGLLEWINEVNTRALTRLKTKKDCFEKLLSKVGELTPTQSAYLNAFRKIKDGETLQKEMCFMASIAACGEMMVEIIDMDSKESQNRLLIKNTIAKKKEDSKNAEFKEAINVRRYAPSSDSQEIP